MKKKSLAVLLLIFLIILSSCGKEKAEEKLAEKIIEKATDGKVSVDINKGETAIKTETESMVTGSDISWPKDELGTLPELKASITSVYKDSSAKSVAISFTGLKPEEAKAYVEKLRALDYLGGWESEGTDSLVFNGIGGDTTEVTFFYSFNEEGAGSLLFLSQTANVRKEEPEELNPPEGTDMSDAVSWPKDFIEGIPEPQGKITGEMTNEDSTYIFMEYMKKAEALAFVQALKDRGFTKDYSLTKSPDTMSYSGMDDKGQGVTFIWSMGQGTATIELKKAVKP